MIRQIVAHYQEASMTILEERVHHLEAKVAALSDALRVLARSLEGGPLAPPGEPGASDGARRAHEILLTADLVTPAAAGEGLGSPGERKDTVPAAEEGQAEAAEAALGAAAPDARKAARQADP